MKDDSTAVMNYGISYVAEMCQQLFESGHVHGLHFYTLNRETSITEILKRTGMFPKEDEPDLSLRKLPWMPGPAHARRGRMELVRPIFWTSRPRSYMIRTSNWDEFPNGRWGDSSAASFGELKDYHLVLLGTHKSREDLLNMWGRELNSPEDVFEVFVCYLTGKENRHGYKVCGVQPIKVGKLKCRKADRENKCNRETSRETCRLIHRQTDRQAGRIRDQ